MPSLANAPSAAADPQAPTAAKPGRVEFQTPPSQYRHRQLRLDGPVATLTMDVDERGGLVPGYELKLNSYDRVVDIELYDAVQRLRFEHPEVRAVVVTSGKEKIFCAGANIRRPLIPAARRLRGHRSGCRTGHGYRRADESGPATDGQRPDPLADPVRRASRRPRGSRGGAGRSLGAEEAERTGL